MVMTMNVQYHVNGKANVEDGQDLDELSGETSCCLIQAENARDIISEYNTGDRQC